VTIYIEREREINPILFIYTYIARLVVGSKILLETANKPSAWDFDVCTYHGTRQRLGFAECQ
jgi:hypothetical protein